jgi:DNA-binding transcriptional MerR regulator
VTVNDLARRAGIPAHVVRYYTQCGLLRPARNIRNSYREYGNEDLRRLKFICRVKTLGFTLGEIDMILTAVEDDASRLSTVRDLLRARTERYREELVSAQRLQQRIMEAVEQWNEPDGTAEPVKLQRLIDAVVQCEDAPNPRSGQQ